MQFIGKFAFVAIVLACSVAFAQRGAASKAAGDYNFYTSAGGTSVDHAVDYAVDYQQYVQETPSVNPQIAAEQSEAISNSITRAKKHFAEVRKQTTNPETLQKLDTIDGHLNNAAESHNKMIENNGEQTPEECLSQTIDSLQKAQAEHQNLTGENTPENTK
jgi:hypothetical protein